jgi:hypothetical protein
MSNAQKQWPLYSSKKQVAALQIKALSEPTDIDGIGILVVVASFTEEDYPNMEFVPAFISEYNPKVGDYLVAHTDNTVPGKPITHMDIFTNEVFHQLFCSTEGLSVEQEPKFGIRNNKIYNRATGVTIPADEPVFIMRSKDCKASQFILDYAHKVVNPNHSDAVHKRAVQFYQFSKDHPERMKEPDTVFEDEATVTVIPIDELARFHKISHLLGSIFVHGGFIAETTAERELEALLKETGYRYSTQDEAAAAVTNTPILEIDMDWQKQPSINGSVPK